MENWQLEQRQNLSLEMKVALSKKKIREWYHHWGGEVYVAFSGGKDSTVLLSLVREEFPDVPAVFCDTGLEYPEIREFVKTIDNVIWLKPALTFNETIEKDGYPVISKRVSRFIWDLRRPEGINPNTKRLRLTGLNRYDVMCPSQKLPYKWRFLLDAPFLISDKCCYHMKERPLNTYSRKTGRKGFVGLMAQESARRRKKYLETGCNSYKQKYPLSIPIAFWTDKDIWEYVNTHSIPYSPIYDLGEKRTGCMFCMFGVQLEESPNRFQRMKKSHPKLWKYCMEKLNLVQVLEFIGVPYE